MNTRRIDDLAQIAVRALVILLALAAVVWVLVTPGDWTSCLVLLGAAVPLAILGSVR